MARGRRAVAVSRRSRSPSDAIYAADAGAKVVLRYNNEGKLVSQIGRADPESRNARIHPSQPSV